MDAQDKLLAYLRDGKASEPTGDGGYLVPQNLVEEIHAQMRCQSRWLTLLRNIWWRITKRNPYMFPIKFSYISTETELDRSKCGIRNR